MYATEKVVIYLLQYIFNTTFQHRGTDQTAKGASSSHAIVLVCLCSIHDSRKYRWWENDELHNSNCEKSIALARNLEYLLERVKSSLEIEDRF